MARDSRRGQASHVIALLALALTALIGLSGCPALMIPGLGYSAYKYEQSHKQGSTNATSTARPANPQVE
jgi:hypothetical protein